MKLGEALNLQPHVHHGGNGNCCRFNNSGSPEGKKTPGSILSLLPGSPCLKESGTGFMILPHVMLEYVIKAIPRKVDLLVFLALLRQTLGHRRHTCETSQRFIAGFTGLDKSAVNRAIRNLVKTGLVVCVEKGTGYDQRSVYKLPMVEAYLAQMKLTQGIEVESPSDLENEKESTPPLSKQQQVRCQNDLDPVVKTTTKKEILINKRKTTLLSLEEIPEKLIFYFESIRAPKKREDEWERFLEIKESVSPERIIEALDFIENHGVLNTGERCHSPMRYLSVAISDVLEQVDQEKEVIEKRQEKVKREEKVKAAKEKEEQEIEEETKRRRKAFETAFPDEESRNAFFKDFQKRMPSFGAESPWLRETAILEWYQSRKTRS